MYFLCQNLYDISKNCRPTALTPFVLMTTERLSSFLTLNASCEEIASDSSDGLCRDRESENVPSPFSSAPLTLNGNVFALQQEEEIIIRAFIVNRLIFNIRCKNPQSASLSGNILYLLTHDLHVLFKCIDTRCSCKCHCNCLSLILVLYINPEMNVGKEVSHRMMTHHNSGKTQTT